MFSLISKVEKDRKGKKRKTKGEKTERQTDFKTYQYQELQPIPQTLEQYDTADKHFHGTEQPHQPSTMELDPFLLEASLHFL